jgi:hypothetical protein
MLSTAEPTSETEDEDGDRLATVPVTLDSSDVGHVIERLEHCAGYPLDVSEMLNEKVYRFRICVSFKKHDVFNESPTAARGQLDSQHGFPVAPYISRSQQVSKRRNACTAQRSREFEIEARTHSARRSFRRIQYRLHPTP